MFRIHRSERADALVDALLDVMAAAPADPFTAEVVAVPTRGVERWLTHRIAAAVGTTDGRHDGVCANVEFPFPGRLVGDVLAQATGIDRHEDPWRPERLVWPLLDVIDEHLDQPWLALLADHLGQSAGRDGSAGPDPAARNDDELRQDRRFATARHLADLFDSYGTHRPDMVLGWVDGRPDGPDHPIPDDARWQPRLWLALRERVGTPSPPERIARACARLRAGPVQLDALPDRISLFGLTRLPSTYLDVLRALATHRDVHLFALHPSLALWERIAGAPLPPLPIRREDDPTRDVPRNPLLRTWAADTREMQLVLTAAADADVAHHTVDAPAPRTLLSRLQADVRADVAPPGMPTTPDGVDERLVLAPEDRSVSVHSCHGRARQVEIARDAICHALADDPTLEPRDVIVLCPDIDEFAPLLHATFGAGADDPDPGAPPPPDRGLPHLPYRLADRSLRQTNPLLAALDALLHLVDGRLTASEVIGFAGREPVRSRFRFDDDDLERIAGWTAATNIRWGLDAAGRRRYWLGDVEANTWRAGLDRVLLGVTMDADGSRLLGGRLPFDDVESGDVDLAGRFAELVDRIDTVCADAAEPHTVDRWATVIGDAVDLLMASPTSESWQRVQVDGILRDVLGEATTAGSIAPAPLSLTEVRTLLADRLRGAPTRADFRTGAVTMCTLVPMRAVPHRVVCILGLDDGAFPRTGRADGDDLLRRMPMVGDRDPRTEDRQLLLDAVLAATDRLIITTTGADVRTNEPRPPAVPLSELLDVIDRTAVTGDGSPATDAVVTRHPLQPFDPAAHDDTDSRPWAFDRVHLAGAVALSSPRRARPPFLRAALGPAPPPDGRRGPRRHRPVRPAPRARVPPSAARRQRVGRRRPALRRHPGRARRPPAVGDRPTPPRTAARRRFRRGRCGGRARRRRAAARCHGARHHRVDPRHRRAHSRGRGHRRCRRGDVVARDRRAARRGPGDRPGRRRRHRHRPARRPHRRGVVQQRRSEAPVVGVDPAARPVGRPSGHPVAGGNRRQVPRWGSVHRAPALRRSARRPPAPGHCHAHRPRLAAGPGAVRAAAAPVQDGGRVG